MKIADVCDAASDIVEVFLQHVVTEPRAVKVDATSSQDEKVVYIDISIDNKDVGIVIGKNGRNVQALQTLLNCLAGKERVGIHCNVRNPKARPYHSDSRSPAK